MKKYGLPKAKPGYTGMLETTKCTPCEGVQICKDVLTVNLASGSLIRGLKFNDEKFVFDEGVGVGSKELIQQVDKAISYYETTPKSIKIDYQDGVLTIEHIGAFPLQGVLVGNSLNVVGVTERLCSVTSICTYTVDYKPKTSSKITVNGTESTIPDHTFGTTTTDTVKAEIQGVAPTGVTLETVTEDADLSLYKLEFQAPKDTVIIVDSEVGIKTALNCGCEFIYTA